MTNQVRRYKLLAFLTAWVFLASKIHLLNAQHNPRPRPHVVTGGDRNYNPNPSNGAQTCINPDRKYGRCIPITSCEPLYRILKEFPINRNSVIFLQKSTCGFSGGTPDVCCLIKDSSSGQIGPEPKPDVEATTPTPVKTTTIQPKPSPEETSISATLQSLGYTADITRMVGSHPNLKLLPTTQTCGKVLTLNNIIGGHDAGLGTHPWMALLGFTDTEGSTQYACGGTLISKWYILTAAHCVAKLPPQFKLSTVRIGEYDQSEEIDCSDGICAPPLQDIGIQEITYHQDYDKKLKKENDIALLRLKKPAEFGPFVGPICLPLPDTFAKDLNTTRLTVAGWGRTHFQSDESAQVLQEVKVPIITLEECNRFYKNDRRMGEIDNGRFCSGGESNKDSCKGDSGGPIMSGILIRTPSSPNVLTTRVYQFGVVSIGPARCGTQGQPALYTKISHFMPWILDHIRS